MAEPNFPSPVLQENYDHEGEGVFLDFAIASGYDTKLVTDLRDFYVREATSTMGEVTEDAVENFHRAFEHRLPQRHRDALVGWIRRNYGGGR